MHLKRVLIVSDDPRLRRLLADALAREFEVLQACDGADGLRAVLSAKPDAALVDFMMPVAGLEMIQGLSVDASTQTILMHLNKCEGLDAISAKVSGLFASQPVYA